MEQEPRAPAPDRRTRHAAERPPGAFFLRTKLLPPRPVPELLPRPRLAERLLANLARPVTLVTANAGSGKTTLVAEFIRQHVPQYVWYQLDHTDADPAVFLGYIAHGVRQHVPEFGGVTLSYLQQSADEMARQPERAADVLLNEILEHVEQQLVLVLDDYHHLGPETMVHRVMDRLLAYVPDVMHIVIISREMPPLNLARMRSQSALTVIDREELLFTDAETQELFRRVFDLEMTPEQLREYRERTSGWITALQLVRQVAQRQSLAGGAPEGRTHNLSEILRQSERDIFDYFAEEVFAAEAEDVRRLLLRIALLDRVEAGTCAQLWPELNCQKMLPALVRRNVFLTVASDERGEEFRLHPLFQGFLRRRLLAEIGRAGFAAEHARLASFFLAQSRGELGVRHLLEAEEYDRAAAAIAEWGTQWLTAGALVLLDSFTEALPASTLEANPRVLGMRAEVARLRGEYTAAQQMLRRAATLLLERGDAEGEAEALHSLATIARRRGDYETAFLHLDRAVTLTAEASPVRIKCGNTRGLCLLANGDLAASEREFRSALQLAEEQGDEHHARLIAHNLGLPAMIRGDFGGALRWLRRMLRDGEGKREGGKTEGGEAASGVPPVPRDATAYLNIARCYFYQGSLAACEKYLDLALRCSQLFNLTVLRGEIFEAYGNFYRESGDAARAAEFYERAARAYEEAGIDLVHHELLEEQAILCLQVGDLATARAQIDRLISARGAAGNRPGVFTASLARGRILLAQGDAVAASEELQTACTHFRQQGLNYYEAQATMALAACALEMGRDVEMVESLRRAADLAVRYDYEYWLKREATLNPRLFALPEAAELLPDELRELVKRAAPSASRPRRTGKVIAVAQPVTDLTINLLGPIEIFRDPQRAFAADAWTTRRARDILCFIATRPHRRASKDTIIDTFWGESDPGATEKNFHPTISHVRKALNSNQLIRLNFLLYRDGDYLLNPEFSYRIDTEEFDRLLAEGEAARRAGNSEQYTKAFEEAVALYRGDFMQSVDDEWADELRAYYREQYMRTLEALAAAAQKVGDLTRSIQLARQILRDDPYREDIHCLLMRAQAALGKGAAVKEQYEALRRRLREELGVEPAAETQRVYRELMK
ncbi:MAG TPA: BTAD domain-containing putative transcriptional regulator [Blastocatellia bacterium]|nr:BTAD domain-containing putative transcriptional regulator [Blastocatellia bacterium]